jgi:hypothetical protein
MRKYRSCKRSERSGGNQIGDRRGVGRGEGTQRGRIANTKFNVRNEQARDHQIRFGMQNEKKWLRRQQLAVAFVVEHQVRRNRSLKDDPSSLRGTTPKAQPAAAAEGGSTPRASSAGGRKAAPPFLS